MKKIFLLIFFVLVTFFASCGDASYDKEFRENRNDIEKENEESERESGSEINEVLPNQVDEEFDEVFEDEVSEDLDFDDLT